MDTQIDRATEQASLLRLASSEARQLGFKVLAAHYLTEAKKAERFAALRDTIRALGGVAEHGVSVQFLLMAPQEAASVKAQLAEARKILASGKENNWAVRAGSDEGGFRLLPWVGEAEHFLSIAAAREHALRDRALEWLRRENPALVKEWEDQL